MPEHADGVWVPHDYDISAHLRDVPERGELVWIYDEFYHGVTLGQWVGWWETHTGSDDLCVAAWMPLSRPDPPKQIDNQGDTQ